MTYRLVLFVHGLGGNPSATWGSFESLLSSDTDLDNVKVDYFSYPTSPFSFPWISKKYPRIQTLAQALATKIENSYPGCSDITLVCHSLGGLIGKQYLIDCIDAKQDLRVKRLLLYAVPNNGASLAGVAGLLSWRHAQLRQLCRQSDLVVGLTRDWKRTQVEQHVDVRYVVGALDRVVSEDSTRETWANPNVHVLQDCGHRDAVKPRHIQDMSYLILKNRMLAARATTSVPVAPREQDSTSSSDNEAFAALDDDTEVRVVVSATLRIEDGGRYLIIRNTHRKESFAPVGGVYKYRPPARRVLDTFCYRPHAINSEMNDDVRGFVHKGAFAKFREWFASEAHRETADECLRRELHEELGEVGLVSPDLGNLQFRLVRSREEGPEFLEGENYWQFRIFEVYDIESSPAAQALLDMLQKHSAESKDLLWVTADEIRRGRASSGDLIAPHTCYFIGKKRYRTQDPAFGHAA